MSNNIPQAIYKLQVVTDNPTLEGFGLSTLQLPSTIGRRTLEEDMTAGFRASLSNERWAQPRLKESWVPPRVKGRVGPFNDYPGINFTDPAFSQRAVHVLKDFLEPNGELLPLISDVGVPYYFYNITTISDALNVKNTQGHWMSPSVYTHIDYFAFHRPKLAGLSIFRIYEKPSWVFVTDQFVRRAEEHGLNGFNFIKVWPFPQGVSWQQENKKHSRQRKVAKVMKQHSLVLIFPLNGQKPSTAETKTIKRYEDELDAQLVVPSLQAPYFGSYEGRDKVPGELRLFLSCPDVDRLVQKLQPWLEHLDWPAIRYAMKRYGNMYDENAEEEVLEFNP